MIHGFLHKFLGIVRGQKSQEGWTRQPAQPLWGHRGKVTAWCRRSCGAVLVTRHPGEPAGETFPEDPHPGFEVPPSPLHTPRNSPSALGQVLPELLDLAVLHAQHAAQQLHHIVLELIIVQPEVDIRKEQKQAFV